MASSEAFLVERLLSSDSSNTEESLKGLESDAL
jgi:hypothetical protein